ncbi:MAG TPA: carboxypeptidase-like regulatory domain-containing protein [Pyrinomonadaceae bacterium]|jgi:hypothetical protein
MSILFILTIRAARRQSRRTKRSRRDGRGKSGSRQLTRRSARSRAPFLLAAVLFAALFVAVSPSANFAQQPRVTIDAPTTSTQATPAPSKEAQKASPTEKARGGSGVRALGSLTGRVVGEDGEPMAGVVVFAAAPGVASLSPLASSTDEDGRFRLDNLEPSPYLVRAAAASYVLMPDPLVERGERVYYRVGDFVHLTLMKGGVITGTVTDENGEPLVAARVRAVYLHDLDGRAHPASGQFYGLERQTDDRGVYRIYGLPPGVYLVGAGGFSRFFAFSLASDREVPTYYPSSSRDGASEVTVRAGQETGGVDIRYRVEPGHSISGRVEGSIDLGDERSGVSISLTHAATGMTEFTGIDGRGGDSNRTFKFDAVADGEYELSARYISKGEMLQTSQPMRVSVRGADTSGLTLRLAALAKVSGRVQLDSATYADAARQKNECAGRDAPAASPREVAVILRRDPRDSSRTHMRAFPRYDTTPDAQGDFSFRNLEPGRFRLDAAPPGPDWYVGSLTLPANVHASSAGSNNYQQPMTRREKSAETSPSSSPVARQTQTATTKQPIVSMPVASSPGSANAAPASDWLVVNPGDALTNLSLRLAFGAASLRGQLVAAEEGARLPNPERFRVYLVPVGRDEADNALRFAEAPVAADGAFAFSNLAPGRYRLLARPLTADTAQEATPRHAAWDRQTRLSLLRDAEAADISVELQPCQRIDGFTLRQK